MAEPRRTFGPVVLAGLAGSALAAVSGTKQWVSPTEDLQVSQATFGPESGFGEVPSVSALALVVLACWGVVLVTRGKVRRIVAAFAALATVGVLVSALVGLSDLKDSVPKALEQAGAPGPIETGTSAWVWLALVGAVVALAAAIAALRFVPEWPEMGKKYDAPTSSHPARASLEEQSNLELWDSIGDGQDPTAPGQGSTS